MPIKLDAIDQDTGINMTISYKLTSNPNDLFKIDSKSCKFKQHRMVSIGVAIDFV